jgi:hypothetical protein
VSSRTTISRALAFLFLLTLVVGRTNSLLASTYVVYLPLDSPIYDQLETLSSLGYLDDYLDEVKPVSRVEAARLTLEAQSNLSEATRPDMLARGLVRDLRDQLHDEVGWLESNNEDNPPTMARPIDRVEAQYIYSHGRERFWNYQSPVNPNLLTAREGTPLLPNNDGIPTSPGSNEVFKLGGWGGFGGFLSAYGEAAVTGPIGSTPKGTGRIRPLGAEAVVSLGNIAVSFGEEEMWWGPGHFGALSQSNNASPIPGLRVQNVHPIILPWIFRYLGQFRFQAFFGQIDGDRAPPPTANFPPNKTFSRPWIDGQILAFKPLPNFEIGFTHAIMFGGAGNDNYTALGFLGRASGLSTGNAQVANTNSRAGAYLKFRFPKLRDSQVYIETLGEDNLTNEVRPIGRLLPFLSVSYQGGYYLPRVTADGRNDFRFEFVLIEPNYSAHADPLYWEFNNHLMGDYLGPNASEVDLQFGHWFRNLTKGSVDFFFTDRAPKMPDNVLVPAQFYGSQPLRRENGFGVAFDLLTIPESPRLRSDVLTFGKARFAFEYMQHPNFAPVNSLEGLASITIGIKPTWDALIWK